MRALVFSSLIVARRSLFPQLPESFVRNWNSWEVRALVLVSFSLQVALVVLGSRRKYEYRVRWRAILWLAYQAADWATIFPLSVLSHGQVDCKTKLLDWKYETMTIWAPLFLLFLCNPDSITAYSLEDNELWLRKFFSLSGSFVMAIYILCMTSTGSLLNYLSAPLLVAGMIKFGERTWVQYKASSNQFRDSLLGQPHPGPNYAKFMRAYSAKEAEGYRVEVVPLIESSDSEEEDPVITLQNTNIPDDEILDKAYSFFMTFRRLFADLVLSFQDFRDSRSFFHKHSWKVAFNVVEIELGFVYDVLYTKAIVSYSRVSWYLLRPLSFFLSTLVLVVWLIIYRHDLSDINVIITCTLLAGLLCLELYELVLLLSSDRTRLWLGTQENWIAKKIPVNGIISFLRGWHLVPAKRGWSNKMAQYNLLRFCLKEKSASQRHVLKFFREKREKYLYRSIAVTPELKEMVFTLLREKSTKAKDIKGCQKLCASVGGPTLESLGCPDLADVEFDQKILLWHIATDLCFYQDFIAVPSWEEFMDCEISKMLSDYMLYLLVICPFMLPNGIGQIRFQDTCAEAIEFLKEWKDIANEHQACKELLLVNTKVLPSQVKGDRSKSVLFDACRLAKYLSTENKKWKVVSRAWVEMLSYAAGHCQWQHHARQLTNGGELLTHVSLLMAHLGLSEQFRISEGHDARVKRVAR